MKIVNKAIEKQIEKQEQEQIQNEKYRAELKAKKEKEENIIRIMLDWRLEGEYAKYMHNKKIMIWPHNTIGPKKDYLNYAIDNRANLTNIIVEDYQRPIASTLRNTIEIETTQETISALTKEAKDLRLSFDEYVRAIFYTTAYEVNQQADEKEAEWKAYVQENTPFRIGSGFISQKLKRKLDEKYGDFYNEPLIGITEGSYTKMLVEIANEHFGIE